MNAALREWSRARQANKKTRREGRVFVETHETRATAYPAGMRGSGRRAREVMPAAMRALDRVSAAGVVTFMEVKVAGIAVRCNKSRDPGLGKRAWTVGTVISGPGNLGFIPPA
jgi:hypothetical protein